MSKTTRAIIALCAASFLTPFMGSAFNLALPKIADHYSFKAVTLTWFNTAFMISTAVCQIPFAKLGDIIGRKRVYLIGVLGVGLSTLVTPLAPTGSIVIFLRFISGVFSAMMFASSIAILISVTEEGKSAFNRAKALAVNTACVYSALAIGPVAGGLLTEHLGWQSIFYVSSVFTLFIWLGSKIEILGEWRTEGKGFDYAGAAIFALSIVGLIYGFSTLPHTRGFVAILSGAVALTAFINYELKVEKPLLDVRLFFENKRFSFSCLTALINYSANMATAFMISLYLQLVRGMNAKQAGFVLISQAVLQVAASLAAGRLSARARPDTLSTIGMGFCAAGLLGLCFIGESTSIAFLVAILTIAGLGFGLFASPNTNVIMSSVEKRYWGQASAVTGTMRLTGQSFSMGIAAMVLSLYVGNVKITPSLYGRFVDSMQTAFLIFFLLCLGGIALSVAAGRAKS